MCTKNIRTGLNWLHFAVDTASMSFLAPVGSAGAASAELWADVDDTISKGSNTMEFEYAKIPDTPPTVFQVTPASSSNFGNVKLSVYMRNMKVVPSASVLRVEVTLDGESRLLNPTVDSGTGITVRSQMAQTIVSFLTPEFAGGGTASVRIWEVGREDLVAETVLTIIDENIAVLVYNFPDMAKANEEAIMEVGISRMGKNLPSVADMYASSNPGVSIDIMSAYTTTNENTVLVVRIKREDGLFGHVNVTLAACAEVSLCTKKSVQFTFYFRDPNAVWVNDLSPMSMFVDGRLPVGLNIENLPAGLTTEDFIVSFITNATVNFVEYQPEPLENGKFQISLTVTAPGVQVPTTLTPIVHIPRLGLRLEVPFDFSYLTAPSPAFRTVVPAKAKTTVSSPIQISLQNFPGVLIKDDIEIKFRWPSGKLVPVAVSEFKRTAGDAKNPLAIQDIDVLVFSPVGPDVLEGSVQVWASHVQYRRRVAKSGVSDFFFLDATSPVINGMVSTGIDSGTESVKIQMSKATQVSLFVGNAKKEVAQVVLGTGTSSLGNIQYPLKGPTILDMEMSSHDAPSKSAQVTFSVQGAEKAGPVLGLIKFEAGCGGEQCSSAACCESASCIESCKNSKGDSCKMACFKLQYFDDLQPRLIFNSDLEGPEIGGSVVQLTIAMLPQVETGLNADVNVKFDGRDDLIGRVYIRSSTAEETTLDLLTPVVPLLGQPALTMPVVLQVLSRPDRSLTFRYTAKAVTPRLQSLNPASCFANQPTGITIGIEYFPYPGDAVVMFGQNLQIAAENITILPSSSLQQSDITFLSPIAEPGMYQVQVFPKSCPRCGKSISFAFILRDPNQPEIAKPIPRGGRGQRYPGPSLVDYVKVAKFPESYLDLKIRFKVSPGTTYIVSPRSFERTAGGFASISYTRPWINVTGSINVSVDITTTIKGSNSTELKSAMFPFVIYDETARRVTQTLPESVPTRLSLYGRMLDLRSQVDLTIANFPLGTLASDVKILLIGGLEADVLKITEIQRCTDPFGDCNRTRLTILAPAVDPPGVWSGQMSIKGVPVLDLSLTYFTPCNFDRYCTTLGNIVDKYRLETFVPKTAACDQSYCLNVNNLMAPSIGLVSPSTGPSTGGSLVTVVASNIPAFSTSDLTIEVGGAASKVRLSPDTVIQSPTASTKSSTNGEFRFTMPQVPGGVFGLSSETQVTLKVVLGKEVISSAFTFMYTPVFTGPAIVSNFYPEEAFRTVDTEIIVQMTNLNKLNLTTPLPQEGKRVTDQVHVRFANNGNVLDYPVTAILSSGYSGTLIKFKTGAHMQASGNTVIQIVVQKDGLARAGSFSFEVKPTPTPSIFSIYPLRGRANALLRPSVTLQYLDPLVVARATWTVALGGLVVQTLAAPTIVDQSLPGCIERHCAQYLVEFEIPAFEPTSVVSLNGGDIDVTISADSDVIAFKFPYDADDTPSVESVNPASMSIEETSTRLIKVYLKNVDPTFCSDFTACHVTFGGYQGTVTMSAYANKILTVTIQPPAVGTGGSAPGLISDTVCDKAKGCDDIQFEYTFDAPPASLEPIDGACSGGETITLKVLGWGQVISSTGSVSVKFGDKDGVVSKIVDSVASSSYSMTMLEVTTPILGLKGTYNGKVSVGLLESDFEFECFDAPAVLSAPNKATLDGRTSSSDGKTVRLILSNFPRIATAADVIVRFGSLVCDGFVCGVQSYQNSDARVTLVVLPPKVQVSSNVMVSVSYTGKAEPPLGADPSKVYIRAQKTAKTEFSHFRPKPVVISAKWCAKCVEGSKTCIANGKCGGKIRPKINSMGSLGTGVITVVVDNLPKVQVDSNLFEVSPPAKIEVRFGDYFGTVQKTLFSDDIRSAFELSLRSAVPIGRETMDLKVFEDESTPISFSAVQEISFFDEDISIHCAAGSCRGASTGSNGQADKLVFVVSNFAVNSAADVLVTFGDLEPTDLQLLSINPSNSTFSVSVPAYDQSFDQGAASVEFSIAYSSDRIPLASTLFTYYAAPNLASIRFSTTGTSIDAIFDAPTDRAGMGTDTSCDRVLSDETIAMLGSGSVCVFKSDLELTIFLGDIKGLEISQPGAAIKPSDIVLVRANALKSLNQISPFSSASAAVGRPLVVSPPEVSVKGKDTIDPCSSLEVRASVLSPRDAIVQWSCLNDVAFNSFLATQSGATLSLGKGTKEMSVFPKEYVIEVNAVDFLGVSSTPQIFRVLKKSTAVPQMEFDPPTAESMRNKDILIKGQTVFSLCPVEETDVSFSWRQVSGPTTVSALILSSPIPQLLIPSNVLNAGGVYQFALIAAMGDVSQSSESIVKVKIGYQDLVASVFSPTRVSTQDPLTLSSLGSRDLDLDPDAPQGLTYTWYFFSASNCLTLCAQHL